MKCENCQINHDGFGRFCSIKCVRSFASKNDNKNEQKEAKCKCCQKDILINKRASLANSYCESCKKESNKHIHRNNRLKNKKIYVCSICSTTLKSGVNDKCESCKLEAKQSKVKVVFPYNLTCKVCGIEFHNRHKKVNTCSKECMKKYQSQVRKQAISNGLIINFGGRCQKIWYDSPVVGRICCDGNWELKFVKWCEEHSIKFNRNKIGFKYFRHDKGSESNYFPDYCLNDNIYVEIKGYETDLDRDKWNQFPFKLIVLKKKDIRNLKNINSLDDLFDIDNRNAYLGS